MDLFARSRWSCYTRARDEMLRRTNHAHAPWLVVPSDDKRSSRLNCIHDLLSQVEYDEIPPAPLALPPRDSAETSPHTALAYSPPPPWRAVKTLYDASMLNVEDKLARDLVVAASEAAALAAACGDGPAAAQAEAATAAALAARTRGLRARAEADYDEQQDDDDEYVVHAGDD